MAEQHPFKWRHFQSEIILLCVLVSPLLVKLLAPEEMMRERGLSVDHPTISRSRPTRRP